MEEKKSFGDLIDAAKSGDMDQVINLLNSRKYSYDTINNALIEAEQKGHNEVASWIRQYMQEHCDELEPREYHEHINEKYVAYMKSKEKEQEQAKSQTKKKNKCKTYDVGDD